MTTTPEFTACDIIHNLADRVVRADLAMMADADNYDVLEIMRDRANETRGFTEEQRNAYRAATVDGITPWERYIIQRYAFDHYTQTSITDSPNDAAAWSAVLGALSRNC